MIKLDSGGNVEFIGKDVLTLNGQMVTLDGEVSYDNQSPTQGREPSVTQSSIISKIEEIEISPNNSTFDQQFKAVDQEQVAICNFPYYISSNCKRIVFGRTDEEGLTKRISTDGQQNLQVFWGDEALAKQENNLDE